MQLEDSGGGIMRNWGIITMELEKRRTPAKAERVLQRRITRERGRNNRCLIGSRRGNCSKKEGKYSLLYMNGGKGY